MENYLSTFSYVKILKAEADKAGLFAEGMRCNYELESELTEQHRKYIGAAYWMDRAPEIVDKLDVGNVFVGVSKTDSKARKYIIVAKDKEGRSVWFPFESKEDAELVITIWKYDNDSKDFKFEFRTEESKILDMLKLRCEEGCFYMSTDINRNMVPLFEVDGSLDDDDEDDEEDDEEVLDPEDKEVLNSLNAITSDDDDADDGPVEFTTMDCVFTCFKNHDGELQFFTVTQGLRIDEDIHDLEHYIYHAEQDLRDAQARVNSMTASKENAQKIQSRFVTLFKEFESIVTTAPIDALADIPKSSDDVEVYETPITRGEVEPDDTDDTEKFVTHEEFQKADEANEVQISSVSKSSDDRPNYLQNENPINPFANMHNDKESTESEDNEQPVQSSFGNW